MKDSVLSNVIIYSGKAHLLVALLAIYFIIWLSLDRGLPREFRRNNREFSFLISIVGLSSIMFLMHLVLSSMGLVEDSTANASAFVSEFGFKVLKYGSIVLFIMSVSFMLFFIEMPIAKLHIVRALALCVVLSPLIVSPFYKDGAWGLLNALFNYKFSGGLVAFESKVNFGRLAIFVFCALLILVAAQYCVEKLRRWQQIKGSGQESDFDGSSINRFMFFLSLAFSILIALIIAGADLMSVTIFGGLLGAGLSIAFRDFLNNIGAGVILYWDQSLKRGDVIEAKSGWSGEVMTFTLRYTLLKDRNNVEAIIPNSVLIGDQIINYSKTKTRVRLSVKIPLPLNSNIEKIVPIIVEATQATHRVLKDISSTPRVFLAEYNNWAMMIDVRFWINSPRDGIANVKSAVMTSISRALHDAHIEIPRQVFEIMSAEQTFKSKDINRPLKNKAGGNRRTRAPKVIVDVSAAPKSS